MENVISNNVGFNKSSISNRSIEREVAAYLRQCFIVVWDEWVEFWNKVTYKIACKQKVESLHAECGV